MSDDSAHIVTPADLGIPERTERLTQFERRAQPRTAPTEHPECVSPADYGITERLGPWLANQ